MYKFLMVIALLCSAVAHASNEVPIDPTRPPVNRMGSVPAGEQVRTPVVQQIILGAQGGRAVIDGKTLRVGDISADARILSIGPQTVLIERNGKREILRLVTPVLQPSR